MRISMLIMSNERTLNRVRSEMIDRIVFHDSKALART